MTDAALGSDDDQIVQQILAEWFAKGMEGGSGEIEELCSDFPHLLPRVRKLLGRQGKVEEALKDSPSGWGSDSDALDEGSATTAFVGDLSDFTILSTLGEGGTGTVFLAQQKSLNRLVALKIMKTRSASNSSVRLRFRREAEITASLDHPHIVPIYAAGEDNGHLFIAMKLLESPPLSDRSEVMAPKEAARVFESLARALQAAHDIGVVHRDVKPANIIVVDGHPYLLDFGFARGREDVTVTREGAVAGTLTYMAPEYLQEARAFLDPRIDIYSLGATLYEALSGQAPFSDDNPQALMRKILTQEPRPLGLDHADQPLRVIIERAMAKEASKRFASAREFGEELARFAQGEAILSRPFSLVYRLRRRVYRNPWAAGFLALALLSLFTVALMSWTDKQEATRRLEVGLSKIQGALDDGRLARAEELLDGLIADGHEPSTLRWWSQRVAADQALEDVLDQLQSPSQTHDADVLQASASRLAKVGSAVSRPALRDLALAITHAGSEDARSHAARLVDQVAGFPRAKAAVRAYLQGKAATEVLVAQPLHNSLTDLSLVGTLSADDHVLAATVLRLQGAPRAERERELISARQSDYWHYRARYSLYVLYYESGDYKSALLTLDAMVDHERHRPVVLIGLAHLYAQTGQDELASQFVKRSKASIRGSSHQHLAALAVVESQVQFMAGKTDAAQAVLEAAVVRWPRHRGVKLFLGQRLSAVPTERQRARSLLREARGERSDALSLRAERSLIELDFLELNGPMVGAFADVDWDGDVKRALLRIERRAAKLAQRSEEAGTLGDSSACDLLVSRCQRLRGAPALAWASLQSALSKNPWNLEAKLRYALEVAHRTPALLGQKQDDPRDIEAMGSVEQLAYGAREHARGVVSAADRKAARPTIEMKKLAWICDAVLSYTLRQSGPTREAAQRALELLEESDSDVGKLLRLLSR